MANDPTAARSGSVFTTNPSYTGAWLCYINRVAVPIQGFNVTHGVWTIPQFQIQLVPDVTLMRLGNEDLVEVAIFYLDQWIDPEHPKWCLVCDGEIVGWQFQNTPNGRMMSFDCLAHIHIFQQLYFYFMSSVEDVVAAQDPSLQASGFATQGLSYPASLFHRGLLVSQAEAEAINNRNVNASPNAQEIIKAPYEFVYNVIRGTIGKEVPDERRALPMMNFFARHIRQTQFHNRWVRLPIFEDKETLAERKGVFPIFEAARNDQALLAMQRHTASQIANSGPVWDLFQHVLRLVHMEISMIPNPACVQVALDPEQDGKILRLLENATSLVDIRNPGQAGRVENRRATRPARADASDERIARMAIEFGREPTVREIQDQIGHTRIDTTAVEDDGRGRTRTSRATASTQVEAQRLLQHYRETLEALPPGDRDPVNLLSDQDRAASETREITTYDVAIARAVQRDGRLPRPDESGFSAGMLDHYRETLYRTNHSPASLAALPVQDQDGSQGTSVVAQTRVGARVQAYRAEQARIRNLHEQQAERERQDGVDQQPVMRGADPLSPVRLAQYSVKPKFLFGQPPACNVIYPSMIDSWALTEDYKAQPTRVYINDSVMTRLLRADSTNRELMLHALTVGYPEEANAVMHHRVSTTTGAQIAGTHETGRNLLIWPREFYEGPKVARMELSSWFQTLIQWRNSGRGSNNATSGNSAPGNSAPGNSAPSGAAGAPPSATGSFGRGAAATNIGDPGTGGRAATANRAATLVAGPVGSIPEAMRFGVRRQALLDRLGGPNRTKFHAGTDFPAPYGTPIHMVLDGRIGLCNARNFEYDGTGPMVVTLHEGMGPDGRDVGCSYMHLAEVNPEVVAAYRHRRVLPAGTVIGRIGNKNGNRTRQRQTIAHFNIPPAVVAQAEAALTPQEAETLLRQYVDKPTPREVVEAHARLVEQARAAGQRLPGLPYPWNSSWQARAHDIAGFMLTSGPHCHFEVITGTAREITHPIAPRMQPDGSIHPNNRLDPVRWLHAIGVGVGTNDRGFAGATPRQGRVSQFTSNSVGASTTVDTDELPAAHGTEEPTDTTATTSATRVVERPTADSAQTVLPATGVRTTTTSGVPQDLRAEVAVAALAGETDPFAKTFYLYAQQAYFDQRYAARNAAVTTRFNPYIVAGYPGVLFDTQRTAFHMVGYVHRVNHAASVGPPGSMQTSVTFTAVRTFYEFLADVRQDAELFARRVTSAPAEIIPEIREIIQVEGPATEYYRRLFYGGADTPSREPAAFNFQRAVGMDRGTQGVVPIEMTEETVVRRGEVDPDAPQAPDSAAVHEVDNAIRAQEALVRELEVDSVVDVGRGSTRGTNTAVVREARERLEELRRQRAALIRGQQDNAQRPYNPQVVQTTSTRVRHNIEPNDEFSPLPDYAPAFEEFHAAMRRVARPVCTLEQYVRFYYGGQTIGALEQAGILRDPVTTFAYAAFASNDVSASGTTEITNVERPSALYWRSIGHLRPGPGPAPSPNERGYTDVPVAPVSDTAGVAEDYPQTRADWERALLVYADRVRNIRFER